MKGYLSSVKRYFGFNRDEIKWFAITIVVFAFIFSFRSWGIDKFDFATGILNFINAILVMTLAIVFRTSAQRLFAIKKGYKLEFKPWIIGLVIGLALVFVSRGYLPVYLLGGIIAYHIPSMRIGRFRQWTNQFDIALISLVGGMASVALADILKLFLFINPGNALLSQAVNANLLLAIFSILPIPLMDGGNMFFSSRPTWAWGTASIIVSSALIFASQSVLSAIIGGIVAGTTFLIIWLLFVEKAF